jgi:superfamily II DNA or RNA helicase
MELRDYQIEGLDNITLAFNRGYKSLLYQQPTGTGKSVVMIEQIKREIKKGRQVLIMVPTTELVDNIFGYVVKAGYHPSFVASGRGRTNWKARVVIATVATLQGRLEEVPGDYTPFVIHDECQHAKAVTWKKCIDFFADRGSLQIGFSATPVRLDGRTFQDLYDFMIPGKQISWFVENGYLAPVELVSVPIGSSLDTVKKKGGEYSLSEQSEVMDEPQVVGDAVATWQKFTPGEKTIVFCTTVKHGGDVTEEYNTRCREEYGRDIAAFVDGKTSKKLRKQIFQDFKTGNILVLVNVAIATEGVDIPSCKVVQMLRKTASLGLYLQMIGRGRRVDGTGKPCWILDHVGNIEEQLHPDMDRFWSLEDGVTDERSFKLDCFGCGETITDDWRTLRTPGEDPLIICENCGTINNLPKARKRQTGERREILTDVDTELIKIDLTPMQLAIIGKINERIKKEKSKGWAMYRMLDVPGVTYKDFKWGMEKLGYSGSFALKIWNETQMKVLKTA